MIDDVFEGLRLQSTVFSRMTLSGDWGFTKEALRGAPFHLLMSGRAWIRVGEAEAFVLEPGDIVILPGGDPHKLLCRPDAEARPFRDIVESRNWTHWTPGTRFKSVELQLGSGEPSATRITGVFAFDDPRRNPLLDALPAVMRLATGAGSAGVHPIGSVVELLDRELLSKTPGAESVCVRLADVLFLQVVRHHFASTDALPRGWLRGIVDPEIAPSLALMHRSPGEAWSVARLAQELGMSRSRFAARFNEVVGQTPLNYLTQWRMYRAAGALAEGRMGMAELTASVGYSSEVAFNKAFRRWNGSTPAKYRRQFQRSPRRPGGGNLA